MGWLPPQYEARSAELRISRGLEAQGIRSARAEWAAQLALLEAPFADPDDDGWAIACARARFLARSDVRTGNMGFDF